MASGTSGVWAVDIGNHSLKAIRLDDSNGYLEVTDFANIPHGRILSFVDQLEAEELVALSLRQFVSEHSIDNTDVIISVPSQNSFARFVNMPPVEAKKIPEMVSFEAAQQIPFDINEVEWDWQMMGETQTGEKRVGIFAIKNSIVNAELNHFANEDIAVRYVQMAPMALYNFLLNDRPKLFNAPDQAIAMLNIGAEITDLVICTSEGVWQRCISMGGNAFSNAIATTFKLNINKAEKLKRKAAMSKYARQILQAMKPVFTDLAGEIQRSIGYYTSSNPNIKITKVIAMGGGTRMRGVLPYLQQNLQLPIERPDAFKKIKLSNELPAAAFHENIFDFGVVYGLALQALGYGKITSNLLPKRIARSMAWASKAKYFMLAAAILMVVSLASLGRVIFDRMAYSRQEATRNQITRVIKEAEKAKENLEEETLRSKNYENLIQNAYQKFKYRDVIPRLHETLLLLLPNAKNNPEQAVLYEAFEQEDVDAIMQIPRNIRKQVFVTNLSITYEDNLSLPGFGYLDSQISRTTSNMSNTMPPSSGNSGMPPSSSYSNNRRTRSSSRNRGRTASASTATNTDDFPAKPGFIVIMSGYSPYSKLSELINPFNVENDPQSWGFVTRLAKLDAIADTNSPFALYNTGTNTNHFSLQIGDVDPEDDKMPPGIGIAYQEHTSQSTFNSSSGRSSKKTSKKLIDPMTKEIISRIQMLDEDNRPILDPLTRKPQYQVNDQWFVLKFKMIWEESPKAGSESSTTTSTPVDRKSKPSDPRRRNRPAPRKAPQRNTPPPPSGGYQRPPA